MLVVPSPKSHDHDDGEPVDLSLNVIVNGKTPEVLSGVNAAFKGAAVSYTHLTLPTKA